MPHNSPDFCREEVYAVYDWATAGQDATESTDKTRDLKLHRLTYVVNTRHAMKN